MSFLELRDVVKHYGAGEPVRAVDGVDLTLVPGQLVALFGPSGAGKSTLLALAAGLEHPDRGQVMLVGANIARLSRRERTVMLRRHVGVIPQRDSLIETMTVLSNAAIRLRADHVPAHEAHRRAAALLTDLGLGERLRHYPGQLSGGERQRVAIARALVNRPGVILADEPTSHLDRARGEKIVQILAGAAHDRDEPAAVLLITHDERVLDAVHPDSEDPDSEDRRLVDRVVRIEDGRVSEHEAAGAGVRALDER